MWPRVIVIGGLLAGLVVRGYVVVQPPSAAMLWDHHEYVRWGVLMHEEGFTALYDHPPRDALMWDFERQTRVYGRHPEHLSRRSCNYPPLAGYLLYAEMKLLHAFDATLASNTVVARVIYALFSILGDCLIAAGCFAIAARVGRPLAAAGAFAVVMLAPPFIIDSARWTQTDSWVLAPFVWIVWAMLSRRWQTAGLLWGVALGLKTQAVLLVPLWAFVLILGPQRRRILAAGLLAAVVLVVPAIPFMLHSGLKWFEESYTNNLFEMYKVTTLKAFNLWYVDLLLCDDLDAGRTCLGFQKDTWGKVMLAAVLLGSGAWIASRRHVWYQHPVLIFTAVTLLAVVIFPTRVHERYIVLAIPFLVIAAMARRTVWIPLVPFLIAATFQMLALDWLGRTRGAGSWPEVWAWHKSQYLDQYARQYEELRGQLAPEQFAQLLPPEQELERRCRDGYAQARAEAAPKEWALTILELASAAGLFAVLLLPGGGRSRPATRTTQTPNGRSSSPASLGTDPSPERQRRVATSARP